ncbi:MAG: hypothetical protein RLZZ210_661 [Pseudomonadota bacterium]|jgi:shikimate dehydrogenase
MQINPSNVSNKLYFQVLGNPIAHSLSPSIHHHFAKLSNISIDYSKQLIDVNHNFFENYVQDFFSKHNNIGLNITLPFKERAFKLAHKTSNSAFFAKASNTLYLKDGEIFADNTDGFGLVEDIKNYYGKTIQHKNILLLGAGGASRGALYNLVQEQPISIYIANRSLNKAQDLINDSQAYNHNLTSVNCCTLDDLQNNNLNNLYLPKFDLIINATSMGMDNQDYTFFIHENYICNHTFAYDMIYNKCSPFLEWSKRAKLECVDGVGMLIQQAAYAFKIWNNLDNLPSTQELYEILRKN